MCSTYRTCALLFFLLVPLSFPFLSPLTLFHLSVPSFFLFTFITGSSRVFWYLRKIVHVHFDQHAADDLRSSSLNNKVSKINTKKKKTRCSSPEETALSDCRSRQKSKASQIRYRASGRFVHLFHFPFSPRSASFVFIASVLFVVDHFHLTFSNAKRRFKTNDTALSIP